MSDLNRIVTGLTMAGEAARLKQMEATMSAWRAQEASATMKLNAQTISGAAGRPDSPNDDEEFYARLQKAARQTYSGFRSR